MWADEQRMAVFRCRSRRLVWDLGVDLWWNWEILMRTSFGDFWQVVFLLKGVFESARFPNAEAFWCGLSNHVRSDLLYLGPYGFQTFSTNSWTKSNLWQRIVWWKRFFYQRLWVTNLWCLAYLQLQHTRRGSFGTIQIPMRLSSWSTPTHPNKHGWYGLMAYYNPPYNWVGSSILTMNCHFRFLRLLKNGTVHRNPSSGRTWDLP